MTRWLPWVLAFVVWNLAFDYQVRRAGERFVSGQLDRWRAGGPVPLLRDVFEPEVEQAAWRALAVAALTAAAGLLAARAAARR